MTIELTITREDAEAPRDVPATERKELRAIDCETPADWARWASEREEYENSYGYERGRKW